MLNKMREWIIHKLGGYTEREIFQKALEIAGRIHIREVSNGNRFDNV